MEKVFEQYLTSKSEILEYFGYKSDWVEIPLEFNTADYWFLSEKDGEGGKYYHSKTPFNEDSVMAGNLYSGLIYTQRFLKKWVYRAEKYTMICADTQTDGNKFLMVFSNDKECKDEKLIETCNAHW